jgi:hypothetical protein
MHVHTAVLCPQQLCVMYFLVKEGSELPAIYTRHTVKFGDNAVLQHSAYVVYGIQGQQ